MIMKHQNQQHNYAEIRRKDLGICIFNMYMSNSIKKEKKLNTIIYFFMFALGTVLGSFYTLAVYRIPLKQNITHTRSYCPKCKHRLNFLDLIPVLSYIFLGGKCRYCENKIRPRYLILEISSGIAFLLFGIWLNIDVFNIEYTKIATLIFGTLFFSTVFITIGIFKEHKKIQKSVFNFGIITETIYMIYLYILNTSIYRYIIYTLCLLLMAVLNNSKKINKHIKEIMFLLFMLMGIMEMILVV